MGYDDSFWSCILDDHVVEEEGGEGLTRADYGNEDDNSRESNLMGNFLFFAARSVSEEEDPRTVRLPRRNLREKEHCCSRKIELCKAHSYDFGETPPVAWLEIPEKYGVDAASACVNDEDHQPQNCFLRVRPFKSDTPNATYKQAHPSPTKKSGSLDESLCSSMPSVASKTAWSNRSAVDGSSKGPKSSRIAQLKSAIAMTRQKSHKRNSRGRLQSRDCDHDDPGVKDDQSKRVQALMVTGQRRRRGRSNQRMGRSVRRQSPDRNQISMRRGSHSRDQAEKRRMLMGKQLQKHQQQEKGLELEPPRSTRGCINIQIVGVSEE